MKKLKILMVVTFSFSAYAQVLTKEEEDCKKFVEKEFYERGLVNNRVCLKSVNYPNLSITTNLSDISPGESDKPIVENDLKAMSGLEYLLNESLKDVTDAKKEVVGYSDGEIAVFNKFDDLFFKNKNSNTPNSKTPKQFQLDAAAGDYTLELDKEKIKAYIKTDVTDTATKQKMESLLESSNTTANFKKKKVGSRFEYYPTGENQLLVDLLRNNALSMDRTEQFCNQLIDPDTCKKDQKAVTSVNLLEKSNSSTDKNFEKYNGECGGRRGVAYNFYFPDEVKKNKEYEPGVYNPEFKIPGRELQNKMQLNAGMEFMKKVRNFDEVGSKKVKDLTQSKNYINIEDDRTRFENMLKENGSDCASNPYQVDNQRRLYWAVQKEIIDAKAVVKKDKTKGKDYSKLIDTIESGDYNTLKNSTQFKDLFETASMPAKHGVDFFLQLDKSKRNSLTDSDKQMIVLLRTLIVGRPVLHEIFNEKNEYDQFKQFYVFDGSASKSVADELFKNELQYGEDSRKKSYMRYSSDGKMVRTEDITYPPADVFSCHNATDALVDGMKTNSQGLVSGLGRTGEEKNNTWDEVKLAPSNVNVVSVPESKVVSSTQKYDGWKNLEDMGFIPKGSVTPSNISTVGWVCQECGSGLHVHPNGLVKPLSRDRTFGYNVSDSANNSFNSTKEDDFSMGGLQHLKIYVFKNCKDCGCVKDFKNGEDLKNKLKTDGEIHEMITYNEKKEPVIDPEKNKFKIEDPTSCMYMAPVPHSCNYDPVGDSKENYEQKKIRESLYCKLKTIMSEKSFDGKYPKVFTSSADEHVKVMSDCQKSVFPQSENSCLEKFTKKGNSNVNSQTEGVETISN